MGYDEGDDVGHKVTTYPFRVTTLGDDPKGWNGSPVFQRNSPFRVTMGDDVGCNVDTLRNPNNQSFNPKGDEGDDDTPLLRARVSEFGSVFERIPRRTVSLLDWLQSEDHRPQVERLRAAPSKEERDEIKKELPQITPSGVFSERKNEGLVQHSGLICLDVDQKDNGHLSNFDDLKEEIAKVRQVAYCTRSVSGKGFFLLVPIAYPEKHRQQYEAFRSYLERFGLIVDSTPDPCRLRAATFDPDSYINTEAEPFRGLPVPKRPKRNIPKGDQGTELEKLEKLIAEVERTGTDITTSYEAWQQIAAAIANIAGAEGEELFHRVSCFHSDYKERETSTKFRNRLKSSGSYGLGTVLHYAGLEGIRLKELTTKTTAR